MDLTIPALAPGQDSGHLGVWIESDTTGTEIWTITINPGDTEAYTGDKTREYIVVNGLKSTGFPPP